MIELSKNDCLAELYEKAKAALIKQQYVSVSSLQCSLRLGYHAALRLMNELQANGVVTPLNAANFRTLTPQYMMPFTKKDAVDEREKYIRRVFETALFFRDMHEESQGGDTRAIRLIKPSDASAVAVRNFMLKLYQANPTLSLTDAALQLAAWSPVNKALPFAVSDIENELRSLCTEQERRLFFVEHDDVKLERAFLRLARYIRRILTEQSSPHTRMFDFFIPRNFVPRGYGKNGRGHQEHVVPCKYILDASLSRFEQGWSIEDVARFIRAYLVIVEITEEECLRLDLSEAQGGLGLKVSMPDQWDFETGCVYARLHRADIAFTPPHDFAACICLTSDVSTACAN